MNTFIHNLRVEISTNQSELVRMMTQEMQSKDIEIQRLKTQCEGLENYLSVDQGHSRILQQKIADRNRDHAQSSDDQKCREI